MLEQITTDLLYRRGLMHSFPDDGPFERKIQVTKLDYIASSEATKKSIADNYVGLTPKTAEQSICFSVTLVRPLGKE